MDDADRSRILVTFSLTAARDELAQHEWAKHLPHLIDQYAAAKSQLEDLKQVQQAMALIASRENARHCQGDRFDLSQDEASVDRALAAWAIILYSRATRTRSDHRERLPTQKWLKGDLAEDHARIIGLRNDCIGHFGPGDDGGGVAWVREVVALSMFDDGRPQLRFCFSRANHLGADMSRLAVLTMHIIPQVEQLVKERNVRLLEEMDKVRENQEFVDILWRHHFDLDEFFGDGPRNGSSWQARLS